MGVIVAKVAKYSRMTRQILILGRVGRQLGRLRICEYLPSIRLTTMLGIIANTKVIAIQSWYDIDNGKDVSVNMMCSSKMSENGRGTVNCQNMWLLIFYSKQKSNGRSPCGSLSVSANDWWRFGRAKRNYSWFVVWMFDFTKTKLRFDDFTKSNLWYYRCGYKKIWAKSNSILLEIIRGYQMEDLVDLSTVFQFVVTR